MVLGMETGRTLTRPRRQRSSFRAPTQPSRARPMVRTPEMASALDQICRGMKDKPRGGEAATLSLMCTAARQPAAPFPPTQEGAVSWGLLSGLLGTPFSGPPTLPHPEPLSLSSGILFSL